MTHAIEFQTYKLGMNKTFVFLISLFCLFETSVFGELTVAVVVKIVVVFH
jgi:hypothetical protein